MQVGVNTFSFSYVKFNFEIADQKRKTIEKYFSVQPNLTFI